MRLCIDVGAYPAGIAAVLSKWHHASARPAVGALATYKVCSMSCKDSRSSLH